MMYLIAWRIPFTGQSGMGTTAMTRADAEALIMDMQPSTPYVVYWLIEAALMRGEG